VVARAVKPAQFRAVYEPMFSLRKSGAKPRPQYAWRAQSTYIRRPPYWDTEGVGALAAFPRTLENMRPLASCRQHHHRPPLAVQRHPGRLGAGEYLAKMGLPEEDFNSYATHRGDHLTAMRATFANPQLVNEMAVVDGQVQKARWPASSPRARWCACGRRSKPICSAASR
jgi:aconitase A